VVMDLQMPDVDGVTATPVDLQPHWIGTDWRWDRLDRCGR